MRWLKSTAPQFHLAPIESEFEMPMPPYPVYCYTEGCGRLAGYKIAARWSDGLIEELKTYALSCEDCLADWYQKSKQKQRQCRLARRETLEAPGIYRLERGRRDADIERRSDLEDQLNQAIGAP
jgi:hypothetical protein